MEGVTGAERQSSAATAPLRMWGTGADVQTDFLQEIDNACGQQVSEGVHSERQ
jgi:hypothetical protein